MVLLSEYETTGFLTVEPAADSYKHVSFRFEAGVEVDSEWPLAQLAGADSLTGQIEPTLFQPRKADARLREVAGHFVSWALPPLIRTTLIDWVSANPEVESTLVLEVRELDWVADLPWELLPAGLDLDLFVVRRAPESADLEAKQPGLDEARLLVAGWPELESGARLEGVMRQVGQIAARFRGELLEVDGVLSASVADLFDKVQAYQPHILHLAVANGFEQFQPFGEEAEIVQLVLGPSGYQDIHAKIGGRKLVGDLSEVDSLAICVLNTSPNPVVPRSFLYRLLCTGLGTAVVGWGGAVQDTVAADFALYWYQRILEGATVVEAMRSFASQYTDRQWVLGAIPTVWVPSQEWLETPLLGAPAAEAPPEVVDEERAPLEALGPSKTSPEPATEGKRPRRLPLGGEKPAPPDREALEIEIGFSPQPSLFPSLLINRQPAIRELTLDASRDATCRLEIVCDAGGQTSAFREVRPLRKGRNAIDVSATEFPALYGLIDSDERRIVTFEVSVSVDGELLDQETRSVPWRARREWLDSREAWPYVPAFVLPMSQAVGEIVSEAERVLAQIGNPRDRFSGYSRGKAHRAERARNQMKAIFHALRDRGLKYITPPGSPVYVLDPAVVETDGDPRKKEPAAAEKDETEAPELPTVARVSGQLVRLPDDVLRRGHATCHDLALLLASAAEYVSLRPLVVLLPGHTFFGLWLDDEAQSEFWKENQGAGREVGERWTISQRALEEQVNDKKTVLLLESTLVTNAYATFERAETEGRRLLQRKLDAAIDVRASRREVQSLPIP